MQRALLREALIDEMLILMLTPLPGKENQEGRSSWQVWYTLWCLSQEDGKED